MQPGPVENPYAPPASSVGEAALPDGALLLADIAAFAGEPLNTQTSLAYYVEKWRIHPFGRFMGFNWPAFLFSGIWCFYRRRYLLGLGILVGMDILSLVVAYVLTLLLGDSSAATFLRVAIPLAALAGFGFIANGLYLGAAVAASQRIRSQYQSEPMIRAQLQRAGGTSGWSIVLGIGLNIGLQVVESGLLALIVRAL